VAGGAIMGGGGVTGAGKDKVEGEAVAVSRADGGGETAASAGSDIGGAEVMTGSWAEGVCVAEETGDTSTEGCCIGVEALLLPPSITIGAGNSVVFVAGWLPSMMTGVGLGCASFSEGGGAAVASLGTGATTGGVPLSTTTGERSCGAPVAWGDTGAGTLESVVGVCCCGAVATGVGAGGATH
jgi:hypothetical protein